MHLLFGKKKKKKFKRKKTTNVFINELFFIYIHIYISVSKGMMIMKAIFYVVYLFYYVFN